VVVRMALTLPRVPLCRPLNTRVTAFTPERAFAVANAIACSVVRSASLSISIYVTTPFSFYPFAFFFFHPTDVCHVTLRHAPTRHSGVGQDAASVCVLRVSERYGAWLGEAKSGGDRWSIRR
jgi:hypothetical protein